MIEGSSTSLALGLSSSSPSTISSTDELRHSSMGILLYFVHSLVDIMILRVEILEGASVPPIVVGVDRGT